MEPKNTVPSLVPSYLAELGTRISAVAELYKDRKSAAAAAGVSTDQLARYMRGENQPTLLGAANMALQVGISVEWLATGEGEMKRAADNKPPVVNYGLLQAAELAVHLFLEQEEAIAPPGRIAKLVIALYKYGEAKGKLTQEDFHQFLQLVA